VQVSNMTRLLKTPIIGPSEKTVASSWIDMLAGLSGLYIFKMPPCFSANAASTANIARNNEHAAAKPRRFGFISVHLPLAFAGRRAASRLRTPAKPAVAPRYTTPIFWALVAGCDAREDTIYSLHDQSVARSVRSLI
jgi:hypothetical protein